MQKRGLTPFPQQTPFPQCFSRPQKSVKEKCEMRVRTRQKNFRAFDRCPSNSSQQLKACLENAKTNRLFAPVEVQSTNGSHFESQATHLKLATMQSESKHEP